MKTIIPGVPPPVETWWDGKRAHCAKCGAEYELTAEDKPKNATERTAIFECATEGCDGGMAIRKPTRPPEPRSVMWRTTRPRDISYEAHLNSFITAIEQASGELRTDYTKEVEEVYTGSQARTLILSLGSFEELQSEDGKLPAEEGRAYMGRLGRRKVFYDQKMRRDEVQVKNITTGKGTNIRLVDDEEYEHMCEAESISGTDSGRSSGDESGIFEVDLSEMPAAVKRAMERHGFRFGRE